MRYLIYFLFLALCSQASYAQKIYKWTDENGKTHYGDKPSVKGANKVKIINRKKSTAPEPLPLPAPDKAEVDAPVSASQSRESKCLKIARDVATIPSSDRAQRKPLFKKLQSLCPNKVYDCTSYKSNPTDVICKASTKKRGDSFFIERELGSGKADVRKPRKKKPSEKKLQI